MSNYKDITFIILAAGEGTRLRPLTEKVPKCLVKIGDKSLLERQLAVIKSFNVSKIIIIGGYLADLLSPYGKLIINDRYHETNMVHTLFEAREYLRGEVIVSYGDIVYSRHILKNLLNSDDDISITIDMEWESYWLSRNENPLDDAETLKFDTEGYLTDIGRKPNSIEEIQGQYMGLLKFNQEGIKSFKATYEKCLKEKNVAGKPIEEAFMTDLLRYHIHLGKKIKSVPISHPWVEIDTVADSESNVTHSRLAKIEEELLS